MSSEQPVIPGSPRPSPTVYPPDNPAERRRRRRVKVSAAVRVRATDPSAVSFTDVAMTIDVSRDGILFQTERTDFTKGMSVGVTFPYSNAQGALNVEQAAQVVRVSDLGDSKFGVAIQFRHVQQKAAAAIAASGPGSKEKSATHGASTALKGTPLPAPVARPVVLAAESDPRLQDQLKALLAPEGYDVFTVGTAAAALDILRTTVPSCFIAEVELPDTSGYDLCLIIKNSERLARVPVVLLTGSATPSDYAASHNFGALVCMAKPFEPKRMLQVVRLVAPPPAKPGASQYGSSRGEAPLIERNL